MNTIADLARDNALHFEGVKAAYRQTKDGVVVSFVVHPNEVPDGLATAPLGSRYIVALVQVGDDEKPLPINQPAKESKPSAATAPTTSPQPAGAKRDWQDVQPSAQAAMRCDQPKFWAFLREEHSQRVETKDDAATAVRRITGVNSRARFNDNHTARMAWHQLETEFVVWEARERVGA